MSHVYTAIGVFIFIILSIPITTFIFCWNMRVEDTIEKSFWRKLKFCFWEGQLRVWHLATN